VPGYEGSTIVQPNPPVETNTTAQVNPDYDQYFTGTNGSGSQNNNTSTTPFNPVTNDNSTASGSGS
jgi:hypothetical protein